MADVIEIIASVQARGAAAARKALEGVRTTAKGLTGDLDGTAARLGAFGDSAVRMGTQLSKFVTAPLLAAGGASVRSFAQFEGSLSKIVGLVGVAESEVAQMGDRIKDLSGDVGQGPAELADALFTITSAGLRGNDAMTLLEQSAKAAAGGMGQAIDVARAGVSAFNAYGPAVLSTSDAVDILVKTAREGNFESSQLAAAIGNVTPVAAAAGVELEEVGATIALVTRNGKSASEAVTQTRAVIQSLMAPSRQASAIFDQMGLSTDRVATMMRDEGLVPTLRLLDDRLGGNVAQMSKLLGSTEALGAALAILQGDAATVDGVFASVADSAGAADAAFEAAAETTGFKMQQAFAEIQTQATEIGDVLAPLVATGAGFVSELAGAFSELAPETQEVVLGIAGVAAAAGPVTGALGNVANAAGGVMSALSAAGGLGPFLLGPMGIALGAATIGLTIFADEFLDARRKAHRFQEAVASMRSELVEANGDLELTGEAFQTWLEESDASHIADDAEAIYNLGITYAELDAVLAGGAGARAEWLEQQRDAGIMASGNVGWITALRAEQDGLATDSTRLALAAADVSLGIRELGNDLDELASARMTAARDQFIDLANAIDNQGLIDYALNVEDGVTETDDWVVSLDALTTIQQDAAGEVTRFRNQTDRYRNTTEEAADVTIDLGNEVDQLARAISTDGIPTMEDYADAISAGVDNAFAMVDAQSAVEAAFDDANETIAENGRTVDIATDAGRQNRDVVEELARRMADQTGVMLTQNTTWQQWSGHLGTSEERLREVAGAAGYSADEIDDLVDAALAVPERIETTIEVNSALAEQSARNVADQLDRIASYQVQFASGEIVIPQTVSGARALGGPVHAGETYLVGERGPELFTPSTGGQIVPNDALVFGSTADRTPAGGYAGGRSGGMTVALTINAGVGTDPKALARVVVEALQDLAADTGPIRVPIAGGYT